MVESLDGANAEVVFVIPMHNFQAAGGAAWLRGPLRKPLCHKGSQSDLRAPANLTARKRPYL